MNIRTKQMEAWMAKESSLSHAQNEKGITSFRKRKRKSFKDIPIDEARKAHFKAYDGINKYIKVNPVTSFK